MNEDTTTAPAGSLRLLWPQWQGAGPDAVAAPVAEYSPALGTDRGIYARDVVIKQLHDALAILRDVDPDRVTTLGGECSVSLAPFSHLAARYGDDLAVVWLDAHPDCTLPESLNDGYHAMAVSHLTGP